MKRPLQDPFIFICIGAALLFSVYAISQFWEEDPKPLLKQAQESYKNGELSKTTPERTKDFNHSLEILLDLEKKYAPVFGNGKLYFNLGNNLFQLEEYPYALLYYYRSELLRPRDEKVQEHIAITQKQLGISVSESETPFDWLFFFHNRLSLPERIQLFFALALLIFGLASCYLWYSRRWIYMAIFALTIISIPLLLSLAYSYALSPLEAVVVKSSQLYRDAGLYYAKVTPEPLMPGQKVKVLDVKLAGKWFKVKTNEGTTGFLPENSTRLIETSSP
ncbi:MAG: hypothetical protein H0T62_04335 [Parachlamydiaceae bacterium]|nr:hypothetical protein [Parachlamydiaceae bacterium]